jgi:hypothetical protein
MTDNSSSHFGFRISSWLCRSTALGHSDALTASLLPRISL